MLAHTAILDEWFDKTIEIYPEQARGSISRNRERFRNPVGFTVRESLAKLLEELVGEMNVVRAGDAVEEIVRLRAVQDCTPIEAVCFIFLLRQIIRAHHADDEFADMEHRIDELALVTFDRYVKCREELAMVRINEAKRALSVRQTRCDL
jgi:hypothetical protein